MPMIIDSTISNPRYTSAMPTVAVASACQKTDSRSNQGNRGRSSDILHVASVPVSNNQSDATQHRICRTCRRSYGQHFWQQSKTPFVPHVRPCSSISLLASPCRSYPVTFAPPNVRAKIFSEDFLVTSLASHQKSPSQLPATWAGPTHPNLESPRESRFTCRNVTSRFPSNGAKNTQTQQKHPNFQQRESNLSIQSSECQH